MGRETKSELKQVSTLYTISRLIITLFVVSMLITFSYSPVKNIVNFKKLQTEYSAELAELNATIANKEKEVADLEVLSQELLLQIGNHYGR